MANDHPRMRSAVRGYLDSRGFPSRDLALGLPEVSTIRVERRAEVIGYRGMHSSDGRVTFASDTWSEIRRAGARITRGELLAADELQGLRTLLHEELHGCSWRGRRVYGAHGRVLEESLVESLARAGVEDMAGMARGSLPGAYDEYLSPLRDALRRAFGEDADVDALIRGAARPMWQRKHETRDEYLEAFLDAVNPPADRRARLGSAIRAIDP